MVNSDKGEFGVYVSADEQYMILVSERPGGSGNTDLYNSRSKDGTWTAPRNLGAKINSSDFELAPTVSPDGKYLYFFSNRKAAPGSYRVEMAALGMDEKRGSEAP